jgi:rhodanese-related sulfurtransferase
VAQTSSTVPAAAPNSAPSGKTFVPHPDRASVEIGTDDAEQLFREKRLFLDARRTTVYADGHIPGARSFPIWESDIADRVKAFYEEGLDQNAPIVIYCSGGDCEDSHMLAEKLYMVGFNNLLVYKDGFPGWQKRGLPAVKGPKP